MNMFVKFLAIIIYMIFLCMAILENLFFKN